MVASQKVSRDDGVGAEHNHPTFAALNDARLTLCFDDRS
jgi:hypothetical protein